jgi:hypothetical protein
MDLSAITKGVGKYLNSSEGGDMMQAVGAATNSLGKMAGTSANAEFAAKHKDINQALGTTDAISSGASSILHSIPSPFTQLAAFGLDAGSALADSSRDEYGVVTNTGKAIAAGILNPIEGVNMLMNNKKNKASKEKFLFEKDEKEAGERELAGTKIRNSIPTYSPPAYGRAGLKFRSKFSINK